MSTTRETGGDLINQVIQFFRTYYQDEIASLAQKYPADQKSLYVDYDDIYKFDPDLADDFGEKPDQVREYFEESLELFDLPVDIALDDVNVRVYNAPSTRSYTVGGYRSDRLTEFIAVEGQIAKQSAVKPIPEVLAWECQRCGTITKMPIDNADVQEPHECQGCERQGPFVIDETKSDWMDIQQLRLQLPPEQSQGTSSSQLDVYIEDDLVDVADAGDRVTVSGELTINHSEDIDVGFSPYIETDAVEIEDSDYTNIHVDDHIDDIRELASGEHGDPYQLLIDSLAPTIQGMDEIKEALVLQMFGGVRAEYPDGSTDRGEPHILLLGDPGTAKSSLLDAIYEKAPCSTYASGKGATAAGMTASAVSDDFGPNEYSLEAGAMVLADNGIACIDEIDKVPEDTVASLHEALSKQTVHINKAGINAHLPTRTAALAAGNPKHGRFVSTQPIADQIDLGPTILSRFDLLFMLDDKPDEEEDEEIIEGMIQSRQDAIRNTDPDYAAREGEFDDITPAVDTTLLRAWVAYAKQYVYPSIDDGKIAEDLKESFKNLRLCNGTDDESPVPVTFRRLEGIQRLAEASARVRLSGTVEDEDIQRAKRLIGRSMRDVGIDPDGQIDADIVETGVTKTQQQRMDWALRYIEEHQGSEPVPKTQLLDAAEEQSIEENTARHIIEKLKAKGQIYEQKTDHYRKT